MPAIPLILAGAGLYLGTRWLARELLRKAESLQQAADQARRRAEHAGATPRDLGPLVLDRATGTYVPRNRR